MSERRGFGWLPPSSVECLGDDLSEILRVAGLDRLLKRPALDSVDRLGNRAYGGDDDERQRWMALLEPIHQLKPVHTFHSDVADDHVDRLAIEDP
jgi:hypothetical protein